ncbi:MAG: peptidase T [Thermotogota bacterium]
MEKMIDNFLKFVKIETTSDDLSSTFPSTQTQIAFANILKEYLKDIGMEEIELDSNGYLMASLPSNNPNIKEVIGFVAHMDTSPDMSAENVNPRIVDYNGGDIVLNEDENIVLKEKEYPEIKNYIGQKLIVTDGLSLLGADDKAGVVEILSAIEFFLENPEVKHGKIRICFTPDEEIGKGADKFDVEKFGADFAYTIDGGPIGEFSIENFNAATAKIEVFGNSVHPGTAKDKMINAILVANEFINMFPEFEKPEHTENHEGFYHFVNLEGKAERSSLTMIIRDHDQDFFEHRKKETLKHVDFINKKYGNVLKIDITDSYYNMKNIVLKNTKIIDLAKSAYEKNNVEFKQIPIRGGTDGARLSYMGLPCPNIFTGGHNYHGKFEYIPIESMKKARDIIIDIIKG